MKNYLAVLHSAITATTQRRKPLSILAALCTSAILAGCEPTDPTQKLINSLGNNVVLPLHQTFADASAKLTQTTRDFCSGPSETTFASVQDQWRDTMTSWEGVKMIDFGPITIDNASWKIQFWPDKHNLIHRKITDLLNSDDEITLDKISHASVVVQGLSALEHLLFDQQDGQLALYTAADANPRRCQLLQTVAQHTQRVAETLNTAWQPAGGNYLKTLTDAGPENLDFKNQADSLGALAEALITTMETVKRDRLGAPLGYKTKSDRARPYQSEAWRSRYSTATVSASVKALNFLYSAEDAYGIDDYLREQGHRELAEQISAKFENVHAHLSALPPLFDAVSDEEQRKKVAATHVALNDLLQTIGTQLPNALGIKLGFNANDGD